jgi:ribosomal protein S18 acetylase RimI-like enzyme
MRLRPMTAADAPAVAALSEQLGYPTTAAKVQERLAFITSNPDNAFMVAELDGSVVGWIHVYGVHLLESPVSYAEIGGLVVDTKLRRQGIGRALMTEAEGWARGHGYPDVRLRSGLHRTEAHLFYQNIGYTLVRTAHAFRKVLIPEPTSPQ